MYAYLIVICTKRLNFLFFIIRLLCRCCTQFCSSLFLCSSDCLVTLLLLLCCCAVLFSFTFTKMKKKRIFSDSNFFFFPTTLLFFLPVFVPLIRPILLFQIRLLYVYGTDTHTCIIHNNQWSQSGIGFSFLFFFVNFYCLVGPFDDDCCRIGFFLSFHSAQPILT